jgi:hypothetical protein
MARENRVTSCVHAAGPHVVSGVGRAEPLLFMRKTEFGSAVTDGIF